VQFIFAPQALTLFVVSLPVQVGMVEPGGVGWLGWLGVAVWLTGFSFEAIGDAQMSRFKADPAHKGQVADTGLWRYTRHPNYFGDAAVWTGIFLITAERWPGVLAIVGPVLMTYLLAFGTGKRLLERSMRNRPGYREYMRQTSGFVPLPRWLYRRLARDAG
jgi:steroid 5-alpha reductase family enzyme